MAQPIWRIEYLGIDATSVRKLPLFRLSRFQRNEWVTYGENNDKVQLQSVMRETIRKENLDEAYRRDNPPMLFDAAGEPVTP